MIPAAPLRRVWGGCLICDPSCMRQRVRWRICRGTYLIPLKFVKNGVNLLLNSLPYVEETAATRMESS